MKPHGPHPRPSRNTKKPEVRGPKMTHFDPDHNLLQKKVVRGHNNHVRIKQFQIMVRNSWSSSRTIPEHKKAGSPWPPNGPFRPRSTTFCIKKWSVVTICMLGSSNCIVNESAIF